MSILGHLTVLPQLPPTLGLLAEMAADLRWTWRADVRALFRSIDPELWEASGHNPVSFLRDVDQSRLDAAADDQDYVDRIGRVAASLAAEDRDGGWFASDGPGAAEPTGDGAAPLYAYFCAEYGWHEAITLYSGGLGILAGDHTKAAADLGVPLLAVGLWYPEGYFHQRVASDGRQEAVFERKFPFELPLTQVTGADGQPLRVPLKLFGRALQVGAWQARVGGVPVVLLDLDLPENRPEDRQWLARLYGGDQRTRIAQEMVLGVAGVRMLRAMGAAPSSWHMNEGHSAFMALERCRELVAAGLSFEAAREAVAANTLFTVHTPVAAGNDAFPFELVAEAFSGAWTELGLSREAFLELGSADHGWGPVYSMPALAIRFTSGRNGVAELHGETSRRIWSELWPGVPQEEVPIGHVTNGVHLATWMAPEIQELVGRTLPADWRQRSDDTVMWRAVTGLAADELWSARKALKAQSVRFLRRRVLRQLGRQQARPTDLAHSGDLFDANALTIGFARRFATYKRATLVFRDMGRLAALLSDPQRPVQLVFAGKAHPADGEGQALIQHIHQLSQTPDFAGKVVFVEDYDMAVGRALTRGVDVWLNNPRRPLEASGTSGQKAAMNGILNLSVLDGWWPEGFDGGNGWAIGGHRGYQDEARADEADADELYELLEQEVVPLYYQRDEDGVPRAWMERAARAIASVTPRFNAERMVKDYVRLYYAPASQRGAAFAADGHALALEVAAWRQQVEQTWPTVRLEGLVSAGDADGANPWRIGEEIDLQALLDLGDYQDDAGVRVEVVYGAERDELQHGLRTVEMTRLTKEADGRWRYGLRLRPEISGRLVYGIRAYPSHPGLPNAFDGVTPVWA